MQRSSKFAVFHGLFVPRGGLMAGRISINSGFIGLVCIAGRYDEINIKRVCNL